MKKQLLDLANDLENNGRFADADLIKEATDKIEKLKARTSTTKEIAKIKADAIRWLAEEHFDECREDRPIQHWIRLVADRVEDGFFDATLCESQK